MKKALLCLGIYLIFPFAEKLVFAGETGSANEDARVEFYISGVYHQIDFSKCNHLPYEVFDKACHGFLNLKEAGKLNTDKDIITVCDFEMASTVKRMWIIDLKKKKVLFNTYVAHGQGTGDDFAESFSNKANTHKSSLGFYVTGETYEGEHGTSLRLDGMDVGYNDAAMDRDIVVHGADYVSDRFINGESRLGRSWGCPAVPSELSLPIINTIKDNTCLFIYFPDKKYLKTAVWLNKKVSNLPQADMYASAFPNNGNKPSQKGKVIQYMTNGRIDSVKTVPVSVQ